MASLSSALLIILLLSALPDGNPNPERTEFDALPMFSRRDPEAVAADSLREASMLDIRWVLGVLVLLILLPRLLLVMLLLLLVPLRKKAEEGGGEERGEDEDCSSAMVSKSSSRRRA